MIRVSISSTALREQSGNSKASGKPYHLTFQNTWFWLFDREGNPDPHPSKVEIILPRDPQGAAIFYPAGEYQLAPSSIYLDQRGNVAVAPRLAALRPPAKAGA